MAKTQRVAARHKESIRLYYSAGGPIAMGTDAGTPFNRHGSNAMEVYHMVEIGMEPADALMAATLRGAELMRLDDRGRIGDGMVADLLLVQGNQVLDIFSAAKRDNHLMVIKDGKIVMDRSPLTPGERRALVPATSSD